MSFYVQYYDAQVGGGVIDRVYVGLPHQRGHGIGSFLGGLLRTVLPLFKSGAKAIGREALRSGFNVLDDITSQNISVGDAMRMRANESARNLKRRAEEKLDRMMAGSGYRGISHGQPKRSRQSRKEPSAVKDGRVKRKTPVKKRKKNTSEKNQDRIHDIFDSIY